MMGRHVLKLLPELSLVGALRNLLLVLHSVVVALPLGVLVSGVLSREQLARQGVEIRILLLREVVLRLVL